MAELVQGEASESEDDNNVTNILAYEISGEASESDEDLFQKKAGNDSCKAAAESQYENNLLQRKLIETNLGICKGLVGFVRNFITSTSKQLLSTEQLLIKSQLEMQSVLLSLKSVQSNTKLLQGKMDPVFSTKFVPKIKFS